MYEGQPRLISKHRLMAYHQYIIFGGLDEYFKDYNLSFQQFNYLDLVEKLIVEK